jgi:hypothetical protein
MKYSIISWILAVFITLTAAVYQHMTGPTHPLRGKADFAGQSISYRLLRSHDTGDLPVILSLPDTSVKATLIYKRFKTSDSWTESPMIFAGGQAAGFLPHQPPAGKLEYYLRLSKGGQEMVIPSQHAVVARFKGAVPAVILGTHILLMFIAMLLSNRALMEALFNGSGQRVYTLLTVITLFLGGMIFGPLMQKYAFGEFWTGVPFGFDLTDNKTLLAMIAWLVALWQAYRTQASRKRWWIVIAGVILLAIYSIPHSVLGSELNYASGQIQTGQ